MSVCSVDISHLQGAVIAPLQKLYKPTHDPGCGDDLINGRVWLCTVAEMSLFK